MTVKTPPQDLLLDEQLDFLMNAPQEQVDAYYLEETGSDPAEIDRKASLAFDKALATYQAGQTASDRLSELSVSQQRELAAMLDIPRQVLTAFREHRVMVESVPRSFLRKLASAIGQTIEVFAQLLAGPAPAAVERRYKADEKLDISTRVPFKQLLEDAELSQEHIDRLMADGD